MRIGFHGADQGVTGSCHLVECAGKRLLVDCGMYQGGRELDEENAAAFGFEPGAIDFVLLTHAHLDHCGRLPLLTKRGFRGEIVTTAASRELAALVMADAAHLHEEEAARRAHRAPRHAAAAGAAPLYVAADALRAMQFFGRTAAYGRELQVAPEITATFLDAGHILGSASVLLELSEAGARRTVLFRGDLDPGLCFAIHGRDTLVGRGRELVTLRPGQAPERQPWHPSSIRRRTAPFPGPPDATRGFASPAR